MVAKQMRCTSKNHNLRKSSCNQIRIAEAGLSVRCSSVLVETVYPPSPEPLGSGQAHGSPGASCGLEIGLATLVQIRLPSPHGALYNIATN